MSKVFFYIPRVTPQYFFNEPAYNHRLMVII